MPTVLGHTTAALALGTAFHRKGWPPKAYALGALCAILPDLDVVGLKLGIPYGSLFGHRGFSHSLLAAGVIGILAMAFGFRRKDWCPSLAIYFTLASLSHGILDAFTSGGLGVAFFAPFDSARYFFPWHPVRVSPLSPAKVFSLRIWAVIGSEVRWIVAPAALFALSALGVRRGLARA